MVKLKYCPECASLEILRMAFNQDKCRKCGYVGEMKEAAPDMINKIKTEMAGRTKDKAVASGEAKVNAKDLIKKREELKDKYKDSNDIEFI